jgi:RNA polymerase sigma-70 factor (ECF subfamily)
MTARAADSLGAPFDEDAVLVARFLGGDRSSFDALYRRYHDRVYTVSKGILQDSDDAHDAVHETFTLIYRNLHRFRGRSKVGTWIFRIAVNTAIQVSRRVRARRRDVPIEEAASLPASEPVTQRDTSRVENAMGKLSSQDRAILTMFYWEDLPLTQIGEALGCSANAAKTRLHRARERFRTLYEAEPDE